MAKFIRKIQSSEAGAREHLRWMIYQVCNGGVLQYCGNGYADDLIEYVKSHDIIKELQNAECPEDGIKAMKQMLLQLDEQRPTEECPYCYGAGELEDEDDEGNITTEICDECHGDGEVEVNRWSDTSDQSWMDMFDNWFYKLNLNQLDDWTGQSHHHSHALDVMEQNKKK